MSRRTTRKTEAAPKTAEAKTMMGDLKSGKNSLPPGVKKEDGPEVEPVAQPPTVGPPPDEAPPEEAQPQPAHAPPEAKTEATEAAAQSGNESLPQAETTEAQRTEGQADQADDEDAQDEDEGDPDDEDEEDAPQVEPEAQPSTGGPPPDDSGKESLPPAQATEAQGQDDDSGKESLPPVQAEAQDAQADQPAEPDAADEDDEDEDEDEDDDLEDEDRGDPVFTEKDRRDLVALEDRMKSTGLELARALRDIRRRQLWEAHRNEDGTRRYRRFEDYCGDRLGHTKQWVTQQTRWLATVELLASCRAKKFDVPEFLNPTASNSLCYLDQCGHFQGTKDEKEEQGLVAVIKEAVSDGLTLTGEHLGTVCHRRRAYYGASDDMKPAAPTYADYKDDLKVVVDVKELAYECNVPGKVVKEQQESGVSYAEAVGRVYLKEGKRPYDAYLLHQATGDDLRAVVDQLLVAREKLEAIEKAKQASAEANRLAKLASEAHKAALAQAGRPVKGRKRRSQDDGGGGDGGGGDEGDGGDGGDEQEAQVELHFCLQVTPAAINPDTFAFKDWEDLLDKLTELKDEHEPKKLGDKYILPLAITLEAVSASEDEKAAQEAEAKVREQQG
jgi:hypothetical protein